MTVAPARVSLDAWVRATHPPAQSEISRRRQSGLGRSGPRSRSGCVICKQRRVRCDQVHPTCGHCTRMQLDCYYKPQPPKSRTTTSGSKRPFRPTTHTANPISPSYQASHAAPGAADEALTWMGTLEGYTQDALDSVQQLNFPYWPNDKALAFPDLVGDLSTSTAGDISCLFPDADELSNSTVSVSNNGVGVEPTIYNATNPGAWNNGISSLPETQTVDDPTQPAVGGLPVHALSVPQLGQVQEPNTSPQTNADRSIYREKQPVRLTEHLVKVPPPPAAMLMGGSWQHLQQYFCSVSEQSRAVDSALSCVTELLTMEDPSTQQSDAQKAQMKHILDRHKHACGEIRAKLASNSNLREEVSEHLLAAVFLLAWFEVTRDLETGESHFPGDLADSVISSQSRWSRTSEELLSWLSVLDSKATHLGGRHLLSARALEAVRHFPVRITPPNTWDKFDSRRETITETDGLPVDSSPGSGGHPDGARQSHHLVAAKQAPASMLQVRHAFINAALEPALQWHLTSQTYWRRVSAHHMHHRSRSTTEDEYEVITACKQIETELFELWHFRPPIVSMTADELRQIVPDDLAAGLEQVFSVFLASFWILFVYMHRVSWWSLPHSELTRRALAEVWRQLQRAYGEDDTVVTVGAGTPKKLQVVHPSLTWLLFVFGSECTDRVQRNWAIEQFELLGEARRPPASSSGEGHLGTLFPLGSSSGSVRNAKRVALLLTKVTEEQERLKARANVREISQQLFGCYISIA